jgi:hypothetical membrane protein
MTDETPLVPRAVRTGGLLLAIGAAQFLLVAWLVAMETPGFSLRTGGFSALGAGPLPWSLLFNASLGILGLLGVFGLLLSWSAFDERPSRGLGLFALLVASLGVLAVGVVSELRARFPAGALSIAPDVAVLWAGVGFLILAFAMHQHERWRVSRAYTFATGLVVLAGMAVALAHLLPISSAVVERVVVAVALAWPIIEGLHIALLHRFAPGLRLKVATA